MREISVSDISAAVTACFLKCAYTVGEDIEASVRTALEQEVSPTGKLVLEQLLENYKIADREKIPLCQDTGMATVFASVGQEVHITGGAFEQAINSGVSKAYTDGYLRASVVRDPLYHRINTGDNTPAVIHTRIVAGEHIHLLCVAKGFGSENKGSIAMLSPADGEEGVLAHILETVRKAGPDPCPPIIIGVGIGGTMETAAEASKRMTAERTDIHSSDPEYAALEEKALKAVNRLGIGPGGMGGRTTALAVHICAMPTHIAGLPVAVNICCHAARHAEVML